MTSFARSIDVAEPKGDLVALVGFESCRLMRMKIRSATTTIKE